MLSGCSTLSISNSPVPQMNDDMRWQRYLYILQTTSPPILLDKAWKKMLGKTRDMYRRQRAAWFGTQISDNQVRDALVDGVESLAAPYSLVDRMKNKSIIELIRQNYPRVESLTISLADKICEHRFDLLGSGDVHLGDTIDWQLDFKSGYRWSEKTFYTDIDYMDLSQPYDVKVPWELSRFQHLITLGQAYWFTGDEKYPQEFVFQINDWIETNPPQYGVNWACTMDVAIRVSNWLVAWSFFEGAACLDEDFYHLFQKSLLAHGRFVFNNLEWSEDLTSNHYLSDIVGLIYLGIHCPQFKESQVWLDFGLAELYREVSKQVYEDGVDFEASISYHRLVLELFLYPCLLCRVNGIDIPAEVLDKLEKMLFFTMNYTRPDGTIPCIGDSDNGRLHRFEVWSDSAREWLDHRYLLAIGAVIFERDDFGRAAGDQWQQAIWLFGEKAELFRNKISANSIVPLGSADFPLGGYYFMRHDDNFMAISAASNGQLGNGGHKHNDTLSFDLSVFGQPVILDPGTYIYTADFRERNRFRSTAYHNTIRVDEQEINRFRDDMLFSLQDDTHPVLLSWSTTSEFDLFDAYHDGYQRLGDPVRHRRQIFYDKLSGFWVLRDRLYAKGRHKYEFFLHFAPCDLWIEDQNVRVDLPHHQALMFHLLCSPRDLNLSLESGWVSYSYGHIVEAPVMRYTWTAEGDSEFCLAIVPEKQTTNMNHKSNQYIKAESILEMLRQDVEIN